MMAIILLYDEHSPFGRPWDIAWNYKQFNNKEPNAEVLLSLLPYW